MHEYGFANYKKYILVEKNKLNMSENHYYSDDILYLKRDLSVALTESEKENVRLVYQLNKKRNVQDQEQVGVVKVMLDDIAIVESPIYFKDKSVVKKQKKGIWEWFRNLW